MTTHPSPRYLTQQFLQIAVDKDESNGQHYVHVRKGPHTVYGQHPVMTPNEAEAAARDLANAAADARRKNVAGRY